MAMGATHMGCAARKPRKFPVTPLDIALRKGSSGEPPAIRDICDVNKTRLLLTRNEQRVTTPRFMHLPCTFALIAHAPTPRFGPNRRRHPATRGSMWALPLFTPVDPVTFTPIPGMCDCAGLDIGS